MVIMETANETKMPKRQGMGEGRDRRREGWDKGRMGKGAIEKGGVRDGRDGKREGMGERER